MFEIDKKASHPWQEMLFEELTLETRRRRNAAVGKACHDFTKDCGVILRLREMSRCFDAETLKRLAQSSEWRSVKGVCQIMRRVRQQAPVLQSGKQSEIFPRGILP